MAPLDILIIGNGVAGPVLASLLLLAPLPPAEKPHITILERASGPRSQGQNVDIRGAGMTVIRKLGLEAALRAATTGEEGTVFVDAHNRAWARFAADKTGEVQTGTSDMEILRGRLSDILYRRCRAISEEVERDGARPVEFVFGDHVRALEQDGRKAHVTLAKSGETRAFDVVVGADGLQSATRKLVWGGDDAKNLRSLNMYMAFFSMPKDPTTDTDWMRWYHAPGRRGIMIRPSGQPDVSTVVMHVISETDERLPRVAAEGRKGVEAQKALMKEYWLNPPAGWETFRVVQEMEAADDFYYDAVAQVRLEKWSKGRVVLLGDAA
jgi:2-polyprenyl-6-methoxyphenol hydroxylase-like FAD-dependent oxidoreductase